MKRWIKGMAIASAVCIGTGAVMCVSAWAMGGRFSQFRHRRVGIVEEDETRTEEVPYQKSGGAEITVSENPAEDGKSWTEQALAQAPMFDGVSIAKLELEVVGGKVEITTDDQADSIRVVCENDNYRCYQNVDGDTLEIEIEPREKIDRSVFENLDQWYEPSVQITIPADSHFREVDLEVSGGVITADWLSADSLDMEIQGGSLNVMGGTVGRLSSECVGGSLVYEGQAGSEADAECEAGFIRYLLEGKKEDFNYEIEVSMGSILIDGTEEGKVKDETVIRNTGAVKHSDLECMAGKIQIDFYQQ